MHAVMYACPHSSQSSGLCHQGLSRVSSIQSKQKNTKGARPRCRLVWSRSLHATADMFLSLKRSHAEPDAAAAAEIGLDQSAHAGGGVGNPLARDMLLELPGVAQSNVFQLMDAAGSLAGLGRMTLVALQEAIGSKNGKALHDFLHASFPAS